MMLEHSENNYKYPLTSNIKDDRIPETVLEVAFEATALAALRLSVLDSRAMQQLVQLHGLVGGHAGPIWGGARTEPEMHMIFELRASDFARL